MAVPTVKGYHFLSLMAHRPLLILHLSLQVRTLWWFLSQPPSLFSPTINGISAQVSLLPLLPTAIQSFIIYSGRWGPGTCVAQGDLELAEEPRMNF